MTAFATQQGGADDTSWTWEIRSVNGRGLDIKLRLPDGVDGLEAKVRSKVGADVTRGNVTVGLRLNRAPSDGALQVDEARLDTILDALDAVQERAFAKGVTLGQASAADVLAQRGVLVAAQSEAASGVITPLLADFDTAYASFIDMRTAEGASLSAILSDQITQIETLTEQASVAATARTQTAKTQLRSALDRVVEAGSSIEPDRIAQELALLAVKSDITEEIDRLRAHIIAARALLADGGPVGRKFDFLTQEFNREANTLCSKAQDIDLTQIGLALKAVIDQMREQVQNVE